MEKFIVSSYKDKDKLCASKSSYKMYCSLKEYLDTGKKLRKGLYVWKFRLPDSISESVSDISPYMDSARLVGDLNSWKEYESLPKPSLEEGHYVSFGRYEPPEYRWDEEDLDNAPNYNKLADDIISEIEDTYNQFIAESIQSGELPARNDNYDFFLETDMEDLRVDKYEGIIYEADYIVTIGDSIKFKFTLTNEDDMEELNVSGIKDLITGKQVRASFIEDVAEYMYDRVMDLYGNDVSDIQEEQVSNTSNTDNKTTRVLEMLTQLHTIPSGSRVIIEGWYLASDKPAANKYEHKAFLEYYKKLNEQGKVVYVNDKGILEQSSMMKVVGNMYSNKLNAVQGRKGILEPDGPTRIDCCMLKSESYTDTQLVTTLKYTATPLVDSNSNTVQSSVLIQKTNEGYYVWYDDNFVINSEESFTSKEDAIQNAMALIEAEFPLHSIEWDEVE